MHRINIAVAAQRQLRESAVLQSARRRILYGRRRQRNHYARQPSTGIEAWRIDSLNGGSVIPRIFGVTGVAAQAISQFFVAHLRSAEQVSSPSL
jgi:hypothetical protein